MRTSTLTTYTGDTAAGLDVPDPFILGRRLVEHLGALGYRLDETDAVRLITTEGARPVRVAEFRDLVRSEAVKILVAEAEALPTHNGAYWRLRNAASLLRSQAPGHRHYLWSVRSAARNRLPLLSADEADVLAASTAQRRAAAIVERTARAREARSTSDPREIGRTVLAKWIATLPPGRHRLPEVWAAWSERVDRLEPGSLADALGSIGRTTFYRLLDEVGDVRPGHARNRVLLVSSNVA